MLFYRSKPVIFDLDDFCEELMTAERWSFLFELKRAVPELRVTMFTIPGKCSTGWLENIAKNYDWIEMQYHGSQHEDRDEWFGREDFNFPHPDLFARGFKAPWWRMDQVTANALDREGYIISACKGYFDVSGSRVYRFNEGIRRIPTVWFESADYHSVHSHIQEQKAGDGLPQIFDQVLSALVFAKRFLFVSELFV